MALTIPVFSKIPNLLKELVKVLPNVTFHEVTNPETDPYFKKSEIIIGDFPLLGKFLYDLPNAKWVQGTWAGIDTLAPFIQKSKPLPYQITRFSGEHYGKMMGEYIVTHIVSHERNFLGVKKSQENCHWNREGKIMNFRAIFDLTVGVLGIGNIGNRIGTILHFLGAKVLALGREASVPNGEEYNYISQYYTKETLPSLLTNCDYIINILPRTIETNAILDNDILCNCSDKKTVFINIGRSNVISECSIIKALENEWLSAAILDVFDEEPLPEKSPLWKMEQVFITPHVCGVSRAKDLAEFFSSNLCLYQNQLPLPAVVDIPRGY